MNTQQAFEILEKGLNIANTKGAFLLRDATVVQRALDHIRQELEIPVPQPEVQEENTENQSEDK